MTREEAIEIISRYEVNGCGYCHQGGDEIPEAFNMAINALKAQEPRVMKMAEEVFALRFNDVVYVELQPTRAILSAIVYDTIPWIHGELGVLQILCIQEPLANMDFAWYGKTWRCWTSKPSDEVMRTTPWSEQGQREYEAAVEMAEYCERYEPTYNADDGSM